MLRYAHALIEVKLRSMHTHILQNLWDGVRPQNKAIQESWSEPFKIKHDHILHLHNKITVQYVRD